MTSMRMPARVLSGAVLFLCVMTASSALGQQSTVQQKCLNKLNKDGAAVAKQQGGESLGCIKSAGKGKLLGSAQVCVTADAKGKVQKKKSKTVADEVKSCVPPPDFGYTSAAVVNAAATQAEVDLTADVYGADLETAVIRCDTNKPGCVCQQKVSSAVEKLAVTKVKEFLSCKKKTLKNGATTGASLRDCVNDAGTPGSIAADSKAKIQKATAKVTATIGKKCDTPGVTAGAFPGDCAGLAGSALATCLDVRVECRVCQMINGMDGLFVNCDLFDDQTANASCLSGTGPSPTSTPTLTPSPTLTVTPTPTRTPTPTATATFVPGTIFRGALTPTSGRFNYNLTLGLAGSNAACNTNFAGTHACTHAELQAADALNELVGAVDTASNAVQHFWAIDSGQPNNRQCFENVPWDYQTAHTGTFGDKLPLTAGHLGALQPSEVCAGTSWVGCCL